MGALPALLFFTDPVRTPDPEAVAVRLPVGAAIVYRAFGEPAAEAVARRLKAIARARGLKLLIGQDAALARRVDADGVHLPERLSHRAGALRRAPPRWIVTSAAHSLGAARLSQAHAVVISAIFPSNSPSAGAPLGPIRLAALPAIPAALPAIQDTTAAPSNVIPLRRSSRGPVFASLALAAGLGGVARGLGARSLTRQQDLDVANARVATLGGQIASQTDTMNEAMTVAMNPGHLTVALHAEPLAPAAEAAVVYLPGSAESWIVARNLPATPSGHGYQLWYADASGVHPLQTVSYDGSGTFMANLGVDLANSAAVMITVEQTGGATGEPGPQVIFGEL